VQYLPSHFWPQLKDMPPTLTIDGPSREHEFPDLKSCSEIKFDENLFKDLGGSASDANIIDIKQIEILQEELDNCKNKLLVKDSSLQNFKNRMESKEQEIGGLRNQIEKLNKTIKEITQT
jgi:molecular chaperone GrpE (heat shock protein)